MGKISRENFGDEASWLQFQANTLEMERRRRVREAEARRPLTAKEQETLRRHKAMYRQAKQRAQWRRINQRKRGYFRAYWARRWREDAEYRAAVSAQSKQWHRCHPGHKFGMQRDAPEAYRELKRRYWHRYYAEHKDEIRERRREYKREYRKKKRQDPKWREKRNAEERVRYARKKAARQRQEGAI